MRSRIIEEMNESWHHNWRIVYRKMLRENEFQHLNVIAMVIYRTIIRRLSPNEDTLCFSELFVKDQYNSSLRSAGDQHYSNLIRNIDILNEHNRHLELENPLSVIIENIILRLYNERNYQNGGLSIYSVLTDMIQEKLGRILAEDPDFHSYIHWQKIDNIWGDEHELYAAWHKHLPAVAIEPAKIASEFNAQNIDLSDIAILEGFSRDNEEKAQNYVKLIESIQDQMPVEFVRKATRHNELVHLKPKYALIDRLLLKASLQEWLGYLDAVYYPNVQDNMMLSITEVEDFPKLLSFIVNREDLRSDKEHLLLIILNTFYEYLDRTLLALLDFRIDRADPNEKWKIPVAQEASKTYQHWLDKVLPESVAQVMNILLTGKTNGENYFALLLDWVSSYDKTHINADLKSRIAVIACLHKTLQVQISAKNLDLKSLAESLSDEQLNWNTISILRNYYLNKLENNDLCDVIRNLYLRLLQKPKFLYSSAGNSAIEVILNNAYYFSTILAQYHDPEAEWEAIYSKHRLHYEGWLRNRHQDRVSNTESYLLVAGIGLAYYFYSELKPDLARPLAIKFSRMLLNQCRQECDDHSSIYDLPLIFLGLTTSKYDTKTCEVILTDFGKNLDHLEQLFHLCEGIEDNDSIKGFGTEVKAILSKRIEDEYWIIQSKYSGSQRTKLEHYRKIKKSIEINVKDTTV